MLVPAVRERLVWDCVELQTSLSFFKIVRRLLQQQVLSDGWFEEIVNLVMTSHFVNVAPCSVEYSAEHYNVTSG